MKLLIEADYTALELRVLTHMANNTVGFERSIMDEDDSQPCIMYRCFTDGNGKPQCVEIGKAFIGNIEDLGLFKEEQAEI